MILIKVLGIKVFAHHGHLPEEAVLGGQFIINVWVNVNSCTVEATDDLQDTVDYVQIIEIVRQQMKKRANMIEVPAKRIVNAILMLDKVENVKVEVEKVQPPVNASFEKISVTIEGNN